MNTMDQHYALLDALKASKDPDQQVKICLEDIGIVDRFNREYLNEYGNPLPKSYPSFKKLAIIYEKSGNYDSAIEVCRKAIDAGYPKDGTDGGMRGRIRKLQEKKKKEETK